MHPAHVNTLQLFGNRGGPFHCRFQGLGQGAKQGLFTCIGIAMLQHIKKLTHHSS